MTGIAAATILRIVAVAVLGLLHAAFLFGHVPWTLKAGVTGLLVLAAWRPGQALLVWAGLAPVTTTIASLAHASLSGGALLEAMTVALAAGAVLRQAGTQATRLAWPALLMGVVAIASALAELPARLIGTPTEGAGPLSLAGTLVAHAVDRSAALGPWYAAMLIAEGAILAWTAEAIVRRQPALLVRTVWFALLGHAAVGVMNISRVVGASMRGGDFPASLPAMFLQVRNHTQYDVNAGASIFALVALASLGLLGRQGWLAVAAPTAAVGAALWIAGSRIAIVATLVVLACVLAIDFGRSRRRLAWIGTGLLVSVGVLAWLTFASTAGRNMSVSGSIATRLVLARTALNMAAERPLVGIGVGTFMDESPAYGATALSPLVDDKRTRDNAHNYFLQTLGEEGALGLAALLAMLVAALSPVVRGWSAHTRLATWLAAGVTASVLTWFSGHPLLVPQAALVFWLFVGLLAAASPPPASRPALRRLAPLLAVAIMASVPIRAGAERRAANLEHVGTDLSLWQAAVDGVRYREGGADFSLYLPSGTTVLLPLRSAIARDVTVELRHDSRLFDAAHAVPGVWQEFRIRVPEADARYIRIDFHVTPDAPGGPPCRPCAWLGKAVPAGPS